MTARECSRTACSAPAVSTLTYVYEDRTAVLGPLSRTAEPHAYDLCQDHGSRLTAPRGWELIRVPGSPEVSDELVAIAEAVSSSPREHVASAQHTERDSDTHRLQLVKNPPEDTE